jgi:hypothetical protein
MHPARSWATAHLRVDGDAPWHGAASAVLALLYLQVYATILLRLEYVHCSIQFPRQGTRGFMS